MAPVSVLLPGTINMWYGHGLSVAVLNVWLLGLRKSVELISQGGNILYLGVDNLISLYFYVRLCESLCFLGFIRI